MSEKKYLISLNNQQDQISQWCYGSCGKAIFAPVFIGPYSFVVCMEENCGHKEEEIGSPDSEAVLRVLNRNT